MGGRDSKWTPALMSSNRPESAREAEWVELFRATARTEYFELLYKLARKKVFGICLRMLQDTAEAEDLTHEVFLRAFEKFSTLKGNNFSGWVSRIACNLCLNKIRNGITQRRLLEGSQPATETRNPAPAETGAIQAEHMRLAREILETLRPEHRKVLLLKYLEGFSYREIEEITGYNSKQVRSHLQNARRNFQLRWRTRVVTVGDDEDGS